MIAKLNAFSTTMEKSHPSGDCEGNMDWAKVGEVTHYFDRIGVAVVVLEDSLALGDRIALVRHGDLLYEQDVTSMQI